METEKDKYELIYCPEDNEYRVYWDICDKLLYRSFL